MTFVKAPYSKINEKFEKIKTVNPKFHSKPEHRLHTELTKRVFCSLELKQKA